MKQQQLILNLIILIILFLFYFMLSENFVTLDRFWWLLGFYAIAVTGFNIDQPAFRRGLAVTGVILLILFFNFPLPYHWLIAHKVYFSLALIITSLTIFSYAAFVVFIAKLISQPAESERLHT